MAQPQTSDRERTFLPSLEGLRGYAFLPVFLAHYLLPVLSIYGRNRWLYPLNLAAGTAWIAVPIFFVLSGYLIGGILFDTRGREGYFSVFYSRRILRVFPVYYLALLAVALVACIHGISLTHNYWLQFAYIQNLFPNFVGSMFQRPLNQTIPYWSLAVEEQFYLLWPLVVWLCPNRSTLIRVTVVLIGISCVLRFAAPIIHLSPTQCYFFTPTRIDGILLGVLLALIRHEPICKRLSRFAKYAALGGTAAMLMLAPRSGWLLPNTYPRIALEVPFANLTGVAIILAVTEEGSFLCRICSARWACWLGSRSYGLYVIHFLFRDWFCGPFTFRLAQHMPLPLAFAVSTTLAFCLTLALAVLSYRFVEQPAMNLKKHIRYGATRRLSVQFDAGQPALAQSGDQ